MWLTGKGKQHEFREIAANAYKDLFPKDRLDKWLDKSCSESFWQYRIGRKDYYVFVAIKNGRIIGYSGYRKRDNRMDGSSVGLDVLTPGQDARRSCEIFRLHSGPG